MNRTNFLITNALGHDANTVLGYLGFPSTLSARTAATAQVWIARQADPRVVGPAEPIGLAVLWPDQNTSKLWLHVQPAWRRQGLGKALLGAVEHAMALGTRLRLTDAIDTADAAWFERQGFAIWGRLHEHALRIDESEQRLRPLWQRRKHTIPPQAQMWTLGEAAERGWGEKIASLQAESVGGSPYLLAHHIARAITTGDDSSISLDNSLVIVLGDHLVGFSLARFDVEKECWRIDGMYVAPPYRNGWATLWMRYELMQTGLRLGRSAHYRIKARDDQRSTLILARRMGGSALPLQFLLQK